MLTFKEFLIEGNPLARTHELVKSGRHIVAMSAVRGNRTPAENKQATADLKTRVRSLGYGFRPVAGVYQGEDEDSIVVHAKGPGDEHAKKLTNDMRRLATRYDQASVFHYPTGGHNGGQGELVGTNSTDWPGFDNHVEVGRMRFNRPDAEFQTAFKPRRPLKKRPTFTTGD